jgi:hypothetical protein
MSDEQPAASISAATDDQPQQWPEYQGQEERAAAIKSLRKKREFWGHVTAYLIVNGMLVALWLVLAITAGLWFFWPVFPMAGWGMGLAFHAVAVYGRANRSITEAEIQKEMQHLNLR